MGIARSTHPTIDVTSRSRGAVRPRFASRCPSFEEESREDRVLAAPVVSRAKCANKTHTSIQVQRKHSGLPCAMALRLMPCSPRRRLVLSPSLPGGCPSQELDRRHRRCRDHTVLPYASAPLVCRASTSRRDLPHPFVTIAERPSRGIGRRQLSVDLSDGLSECLRAGWTARIALNGLANFDPASSATDRVTAMPALRPDTQEPQSEESTHPLTDRLPYETDAPLLTTRRGCHPPDRAETNTSIRRGRFSVVHERRIMRVIKPMLINNHGPAIHPTLAPAIFSAKLSTKS